LIFGFWSNKFKPVGLKCTFITDACELIGCFNELLSFVLGFLTECTTLLLVGPKWTHSRPRRSILIQFAAVTAQFLISRVSRAGVAGGSCAKVCGTLRPEEISVKQLGDSWRFILSARTSLDLVASQQHSRRPAGDVVRLGTFEIVTRIPEMMAAGKRQKENEDRRKQTARERRTTAVNPVMPPTRLRRADE
jgi:hypothetical protein